MTRREFEKIVLDAVKSLPEPFRGKIENVSIRVAESPHKRRSSKTGGREPSLYGLYEGVPRTERTAGDPPLLPDKITIFKRAIERDHRTRADMIRCIQETVLHEVGHYFGLDDAQLDELGLG